MTAIASMIPSNCNGWPTRRQLTHRQSQCTAMSTATRKNFSQDLHNNWSHETTPKRRAFHRGMDKFQTPASLRPSTSPRLATGQSAPGGPLDYISIRAAAAAGIGYAGLHPPGPQGARALLRRCPSNAELYTPRPYSRRPWSKVPCSAQSGSN